MNTITERAVPIPSILQKVAMALTGALMAGWLTLHMLGNMFVFAGPELYNAYGEKLRASGLLWPMRIMMVGALSVHVVAAWATTRRAFAARPVRYRAGRKYGASTLASRTMRITGALLLPYLVYHIAMIYGVGHPSFRTGDAHHNLVALLQIPWHATAYVTVTGLMALHLAHGLTSALVSLGWAQGMTEGRLRRVMHAWAAIVTGGFAAQTLAIALGWV
jgi:succinate dehydrogenase / fumarate reductase cytochrome b subunit